MATLLIATRNAGKLEEISRLIAGAPIQTVSLADVGVDREVDETGETFEANSTLKASTYARLSGLPTLADDSGLEVDALGGEPGVRSSRYAGDDATDADRVAFLLGRLQNEGRGPWQARFRCVIAIAWRHDEVELHAGVCEGVVIDTPCGSNGSATIRCFSSRTSAGRWPSCLRSRRTASATGEWRSGKRRRR